MGADGTLALVRGEGAMPITGDWRPSTTSYIEPHERGFAEAFTIQEFLALAGKEPPRPTGYNLAVKIFTRAKLKAKGGKHEFIAAGLTTTEDKYQSCAALVLAVGPGAYKGTDREGNPRFPEGPWCFVGDWVIIPRYEGFQIDFRGQPLQIIADDKIAAVIQDPEDVLAQHMADRS